MTEIKGDLISREALKAEVRKHAEYYADRTKEDRYNVGYTECACEILDFIDNAETVESKQGEWIIVGRLMKNGKPLAVRCSECNKSPKYAVTSDFCPNCGAEMKGGAE